MAGFVGFLLFVGSVVLVWVACPGLHELMLLTGGALLALFIFAWAVWYGLVQLRIWLRI